jgi:hypothetical protein
MSKKVKIGISNEDIGKIVDILDVVSDDVEFPLPLYIDDEDIERIMFVLTTVYNSGKSLKSKLKETDVLFAQDFNVDGCCGQGCDCCCPELEDDDGNTLCGTNECPDDGDGSECGGDGCPNLHVERESGEVEEVEEVEEDPRHIWNSKNAWQSDVWNTDEDRNV